MDLEDMIDDFITFFIAGQETTANALAFCFYELARNKKLCEKYHYKKISIKSLKHLIFFNFEGQKMKSIEFWAIKQRLVIKMLLI
jgi:hypothetical protein